MQRLALALITAFCALETAGVVSKYPELRMIEEVATGIGKKDKG